MAFEKSYNIDNTLMSPQEKQEAIGTLNEAIRGKADTYTGRFQQGFLEAGHPVEEFLGRNVQGSSGVVKQGVVDLAQPFIEEYYKATGTMPDIDQIDQFVSGNLTSGYIEGVINGTNNPAIIASQVARPYINSNPDIQNKIKKPGQDSLQDETSKLYKGLSDFLTEKINRDTAEKMKQNYESEAVLGRLRSPASIATASKVQEQGQQALASGLAGLASTQATGSTDLAKTIANIQESGRQYNMGYGLKGKELGLTEDQLITQKRLGNKQLGLAREIGQMQADANKPGTLDYINTGIKGLAAGADIVRAFKGN